MHLLSLPGMEKKLKLGIIREGKFPPDSRVAITPEQCKLIQHRFPEIEITVQLSHGRCFNDTEFTAGGFPVKEDISDCDVLIGVKEVPIELLIPNKTYLFFAHVIKKQAHNKPLIRALLDKKIRMIDYECLRDEDGNRVIAFGRWAGIVGAYNAFYTWGKRSGDFSLKRAKDYKDYKALKHAYTKIILPPIKIVLTGTGRVAQGSMEVLNALKIQQVSNSDFLTTKYPHPVFTVLDTNAIYDRISDGGYERKEFHMKPELYKSIFLPYAKQCDIMINAIYWNPKAARLFEKSDMHHPDFKIQVIADISCDVNGGVPATLNNTTINEPVFGYNIHTDQATAPYETDTIDIMAIDNLPNELPRDASEEFGNLLINNVIAELLKLESRMIYEATICADGKLNTPYLYLKEYAGEE
ncbi:MAG TPA: NAD(P)-dependent oxidoreductase [Chitinophagales bacterium]|nr:NAD(P)-dependent oxidoreductase [Chitinophagales bacterium]